MFMNGDLDSGLKVTTVVWMVIEWLTFEVTPREQDEWLSLEESVWSRFLELQPGFVRKEIWIDENEPGLVNAVIWWENMDLWKAITADHVAAVDERMGDAWKPCTMKVYQVRRQS